MGNEYKDVIVGLRTNNASPHPGDHVTFTVAVSEPPEYRNSGQVFLLLPPGLEKTDAQWIPNSDPALVDLTIKAREAFTGLAPDGAGEGIPGWVDVDLGKSDPRLLASYSLTGDGGLSEYDDRTNQVSMKWTVTVRVKKSGHFPVRMWFLDSANKTPDPDHVKHADYPLDVAQSSTAPDIKAVTLTGAAFYQPDRHIWWLGPVDRVAVVVEAQSAVGGDRAYLRWRVSGGQWHYAETAGVIDAADRAKVSFPAGVLSALALPIPEKGTLDFALALAPDKTDTVYSQPASIVAQKETAPAWNHLLASGNQTQLVLSGTIVSPESGIQSVEYSLDGKTGRGPVSVTRDAISHGFTEKDFRHGIFVRATSRIGNVSAWSPALIDAATVYKITWPDYTDPSRGTMPFRVIATASNQLLLPVEESEVSLPPGLVQTGGGRGNSITKQANELDLAVPDVVVANEQVDVVGVAGTPIGNTTLTLRSKWFKDGRVQFHDSAGHGKFRDRPPEILLQDHVIANSANVALPGTFRTSPEPGKKLSFRYRIGDTGQWKDLPDGNLDHHDGGTPFTVRLPSGEFPDNGRYRVFLQVKYGEPSQAAEDYTTAAPVNLEIESLIDVSFRLDGTRAVPSGAGKHIQEIRDVTAAGHTMEIVFTPRINLLPYRVEAFWGTKTRHDAAWHLQPQRHPAIEPSSPAGLDSTSLHAWDGALHSRLFDMHPPDAHGAPAACTLTIPLTLVSASPGSLHDFEVRISSLPGSVPVAFLHEGVFLLKLTIKAS